MECVNGSLALFAGTHAPRLLAVDSFPLESDDRDASGFANPRRWRTSCWRQQPCCGLCINTKPKVRRFPLLPPGIPYCPARSFRAFPAHISTHAALAMDYEKAHEPKVEAHSSNGSNEGDVRHGIYDESRPSKLTRMGLTPSSFKRRTLADEHNQLNKTLKTRHLHMIAIGGSIGAGLFVGSGDALATGGPASLLICFGIIGVVGPRLGSVGIAEVLISV